MSFHSLASLPCLLLSDSDVWCRQGECCTIDRKSVLSKGIKCWKTLNLFIPWSIQQLSLFQIFKLFRINSTSVPFYYSNTASNITERYQGGFILCIIWPTLSCYPAWSTGGENWHLEDGVCWISIQGCLLDPLINWSANKEKCSNHFRDGCGNFA